MCGITGSIRWQGRNDAEARAVERMTAALFHRGPDAGGVIIDGAATLGHRRLAVIDVAEAANQPMQDPESGAWIVFNGEIYNFRELRRSLEADGIRFTTASDTEVLLKGYMRHGEAWLDRLVGMFAFALWRPDQQKLVLVRDRLGKKPLYYQRLDDGILFASELGALRCHPEAATRINQTALGHYLAQGYTPTDHCILEGVSKLPAGHLMTITPDGFGAPRSYWDLASKMRNKAHFRNEAEAAEAVGAALDDAVRARLVSDVPLGVFLSGGVDSAAIAESMHRQDPGAGVGALTMDFDIADHSEAAAAAETARLLGIEHSIETVTADAMQHVETIAGFADEPFADTSMLPFYHLSAAARRTMTVVLSGDGSDELFAGYVTFAADRLHALTRPVPAPLVAGARWLVDAFWPTSHGKVSTDYKLKRFLAGHGLSADRAHCFWRGIFDADERLALLRPEHREARDADPFDAIAPHFDAVADCDPLDRASYVDIKTWLVDDILVKVDRMSMAHALEVRAPFLDHRLVELAASLPSQWKFRNFSGKRVLRRALSARLPRTVLSRKKSGFNAPVSAWLDGPFGTIGREMTMGAPMLEWFEPAAIERLWSDHHAHRRDNGFKLFTLLCLALWLRNPAAEITPSAA